MDLSEAEARLFVGGIVEINESSVKRVKLS